MNGHDPGGAATWENRGCRPYARRTSTHDAGLSPDAVTSDPIRRAGQEAASFFRSPEANKPAAAARAIADTEFLAANVPVGPRWRSSSPTAITQLAQARNQGRAALDIPASAPAQGVIDGLLAAAAALDVDRRPGVARALPRSIFRAGPNTTVQRLSQPPRIRSVGPALAGLYGGSAGGR
ncbi:hypothetical protein [Neoroseomonas lacus]|uniref:Uncharacterized protein n=1 Tax=Neoroseomonas lacus TaxID=287609 RepID=A0A917K3A5_9PROT|nr:hypothetical protein [Neoroseomonas lacus]GGI98385.1 hypothetical protein GCM10011320_01450 [Neoroseomonas lacus]